MIEPLLKYVPPSRHKDYLGLVQRIPFFARALCVCGESGAALGYLLKKRPGTQVCGIVPRPELVTVARQMLDAVAVAPGPLDALPVETLDGVVFCNLEESPETACGVLSQLRDRLPPFCAIYALFADPDFAKPGAPSGLSGLQRAIEATLAGHGFRACQTWPLENGVEGSDTPCGCLLMAVPQDYDELAHARALLAEGEPSLAFERIEMTPRGPSESPDRCLMVHWERLQIVAAWLEADPDTQRSYRLMAAQESFYYIVYTLPADPAAYQAMARCWELAGDGDMARRLLRSIQLVTPTEAGGIQLSQLPVTAADGTPVVDVPDWDGKKQPRILFLMNPRPHYGIDVLYDGLCDCLGDGNVVDYPYKPLLHGQDTDEMKNYPCRFNRPGAPCTLEDILAQLDGGRFDLILYADVEGILPREAMRALVHRVADVPVALVDGLDEFIDFRGRLSEHLGFDRFIACFKREKHRAMDYGPHCYPLPFAYDGRKAVADLYSHREGVFWAGHRMFGARRLYVECLEAHYGWKLDGRFSQEDYIRRIRAAAIGLNCFGMGFDTVRYWELPAQGCMLLSDRLPIELPHNFADGKEAVFFDDLPDLLEKMDYYLAHPEIVAEIAAAGHAHFLRHHTNEARARQLLGWVAGLM